MTTFDETHVNVAKEFANATIAALACEGSIHPGTVIAAAARMAGTYLFRSFRLDLRGVRPGQVVLSASADEQFPVLIRIAAMIVGTFGITLDDKQASTPIDPNHEPRLSFLETQLKLEPIYRAITDQSGMSDYEGGRAAAVAAAILIAHCSKVLDPNMGFRILSISIVEGTKTAPDPVRLTKGAA